MAQQESDWGLKWELLVADAWADPELMQRLLKDPQTVLKERGIAAPPGKQFKVVEETEDTIHLNVPPKPEEEELSEEQLGAVAGRQWGPPPPPCFPPPRCFPPPVAGWP